MNKIKVFYDGNCPICSKEINLYKKIDLSKKFEWVNIDENRKLLSKHSIKYEDAMKIFHVIDQDDKLHKGVDGFLIIWKELKYWKFLYFLIKQPLIKQFTEFCYKYFAIYRYKKKS